MPAGTRARDFRIAGARAAGAVDVLRARTESARDRRGAQGQRESGLPDPRPGAAAPARTAQVLAGSGRYIACLTCQFPLSRRIALGERDRVRGALAKSLIGQPPHPNPLTSPDRKSLVQGKSVSERVGFGCRVNI